MQTKTLAAWFIIILMALSAAGYAFLSSTAFAHTNPQQAQPTETAVIVERPLTPSELSSALQQGKVVFRSSHPAGCSACAEADAAIEQFSRSYSLFVLFEKLTANETKLQLIGGAGRIIDLQPPLTQESLLETFCTAAPIQPRECILRNIGKAAPANASTAPAHTLG